MTLVEPRDPYGQALSSLRRFTLEGRFGWGEPLVVKDLAEEIGLSPTPVREALACLAGQGLIERRRGKGYFFPALTGPDIIDLYDLERTYVHAALALHPPSIVVQQKVSAEAAAIGFPGVFRMIVAHTANETLLSAFDRLAEQLAPVRQARAALGHVDRPAAREFAGLLAADDRLEVLTLLEAHQRQRCDEASEIARFLQRSARARR